MSLGAANDDRVADHTRQIVGAHAPVAIAVGSRARVAIEQGGRAGPDLGRRHMSTGIAVSGASDGRRTARNHTGQRPRGGTDRLEPDCRVRRVAAGSEGLRQLPQPKNHRSICWEQPYLGSEKARERVGPNERPGFPIRPDGFGDDHPNRFRKQLPPVEVIKEGSAHLIASCSRKGGGVARDVKSDRLLPLDKPAGGDRHRLSTDFLRGRKLHGHRNVRDRFRSVFRDGDANVVESIAGIEIPLDLVAASVDDS